MKSPNAKLVEAAQFGNLTLAKRAVAESANLNCTHRGRTALHWAVQEGHLNVVRYLIRAGASVNRTEKFGSSPLQQAAGEGRASILNELIRAGAKLNVRGLSGGTALHTACAYGHKSCVQLLLHAGALANLTDDDNRTPRYYAKMYGHKAISKMVAAANTKNGKMPNKNVVRTPKRRRTR